MMPRLNIVCFIVVVAMVTAMRGTDAFQISWSCNIDACDLRVRVEEMADILKMHEGEMEKFVKLNLDVDRMMNGLNYQQNTIDSLSKRLNKLEAILSNKVTQENETDESNQLGQTVSEGNAPTFQALSSNMVEIVERLDHKTSNLTSQVNSLWNQNKKLSAEVSFNRRRSNYFYEELGKLTNDSAESIEPRSKTIAENESYQNLERHAYRENITFISDSNFNSTEVENEVENEVETGRNQRDVESRLHAEEIILKAEQRLAEIELKLLGIDNIVNITQLGNSIEDFSYKLDNVNNRTELGNHEMKKLREEVSRNGEVGRFLNDRINFMNKCLVNLTDNFEQIASAENVSQAEVLREMNERKSLLNRLKQDLEDLKNQSYVRISENLQRNIYQEPDLETEFFRNAKEQLVAGVLQEIANSSSWTKLHDGNYSDPKLTSDEMSSRSDAVITAINDFPVDARNRSIVQKLDFLEDLIKVVNSSFVVKADEIKLEYDRLLTMIVKHFAKEQEDQARTGQTEEQAEMEAEPFDSKVIDVIEVIEDDSSTRTPFDISSNSSDSDDSVSINVLPDFETIQSDRSGTTKSCQLKPPMDENVLAYYNEDIVNDFTKRIPSGGKVYFRCEDIGQYDLVGLRTISCEEGRWIIGNGHIPWCDQLVTEPSIREMLENSKTKKLTCPESSGSFAHPHHCDKYLNCYDWVPQVMSCPRPLVFSIKEKGCSWSYDVDCSARDLPVNIDKNVAKIRPSISISPRPGSAGVSVAYDSKMRVYPGTTFELHCVFPKKFGVPKWVAQVTRNPASMDEIINYPSFWIARNDEVDDGENESSIRYGIRVDNAQEKDSGTYTCILPSSRKKSIQVIVEAIDCPKINNGNDNLITKGHVSNKMSAKIVFACKEGFKLIGPSELECMPSGRWSQKKPKCIQTENSICTGSKCARPDAEIESETVGPLTGQPLGCLKPYLIGREPLSIVPDKIWYDVSEKVYFRCPTGFEMTGDVQIITCRNDFTWDAKRMPKCVRIEK